MVDASSIVVIDPITTRRTPLSVSMGTSGYEMSVQCGLAYLTQTIFNEPLLLVGPTHDAIGDNRLGYRMRRFTTASLLNFDIGSYIETIFTRDSSSSSNSSSSSREKWVASYITSGGHRLSAQLDLHMTDEAVERLQRDWAEDGPAKVWVQQLANDIRLVLDNQVQDE